MINKILLRDCELEYLNCYDSLVMMSEFLLENKNKEEIDLFCINKDLFEKILEYCQHVEQNKEETEQLIQKYLTFKNETELFYFINVVNYLNIKKLLLTMNTYIPIIYPDFCGKKPFSYFIFELQNNKTFQLYNNCLFNSQLPIDDQSATLLNMVEDTEISQTINLEIINIKTFIYILEYCYLKQTVELEEIQKNKIKKFLDLFKNKDSELFDVINMSDYLNIKSLLDITCEKIANYIEECKTTEEIRKRFGINNDFTPEEEEENKKIQEVYGESE